MSTNGNYWSPNHSTFDKDSGKASKWRGPNPSKFDKESGKGSNEESKPFYIWQTEITQNQTF